MPSIDPTSHTDDDAGCVARVLAGEPAAFRILVERHEPALRALLGWILPLAADREDIAQEAFLAAWRHLGTFDRRRGTFAGWLLRIGRNLAFNQRRARGGGRRTPEGQLTVEPAAPEDSTRAEPDRRLGAALRALPEDQRLAFLLAVVHELPLSEVALLADAPLGTIKSRVWRASERLRAALGDVVEPIS